MKVLLLASVSAALFAITFYQSGSAAGLWFLRLFTGFAVLLALFGPGRNVFKVARIGREGLAAQAEVTQSRVGADQSKRLQVHGHRVVHHPVLGDFRDEFTIVAPWAPSVTQDVTLEVLVAPDHRRTWATLGVDRRVSANPHTVGVARSET